MLKMIRIIGLAAMAFAATGRAQQLMPDVPKAEHVTEKVKLSQNYELKGDIARAREAYGDAVVYYRSALRTNSKDPQLYNKLGIAYLKIRQTGQARKSFTQAVKLDPTYVTAYNNLGATECLDKKYTQAVHHLKKALALEETNASAHLNMAEAWMGLEQMDRAMTEYARALELNADILSGTPQGVQVNVKTPEQRARVSFLIAKAYAKRGNVDGALEYLRRARDEHFPKMGLVYEDPAFTPLWTDPRLDKIVKRPS